MLKVNLNMYNRLKFALHRLQNDIMQIFRNKREHNLIRSIGKVYRPFTVGDKVGLVVECLPAGFKSLKLFPRFRGPFTVTKVMGEGKVLYLDDPFGQPLPVPISCYRVKSWLERSDMKEIMGDDDGSKESDGIGSKGLTRKLNVTKKSKVTPTLTHVPDKTCTRSRSVTR